MKNNYKAVAWYAAACSLVAAGMAFTFWSFDQIDHASQQRKVTRDLMAEAAEFMDRLVDAETGERGYVLTGEEAYLQPYAAVQANLRGDLQALRLSNTSAQAREHLDAVVPLLDAKLDALERTIALRRSHNMAGALALINGGQEKRSMDAIRAEFSAFDRILEEAQMQSMVQFEASMRRMFAIIVSISLLALLLALYFAYSSFRAAQQRLKESVHLETLHLLEIQTESNRQLEESNQSLQVSQEKLSVTLNSIGDAVIATDAAACVTLLNPVAENLTGWSHSQALGRPVDEVFHIIGKHSRQRAVIPVTDVLAVGSIQGLANHTVLISRDGREFDIADSCAPIRDADGAVTGAVLVFRNVTAEYATEQTIRDSVALVQTILNTVADGIVTIHAEGGRIESVNPATEHMFGYSAADVTQKGLNLLIPELDQVQHNVTLDYFHTSDAERAMGQVREVTGRRKDGSSFPLEIAVSEMALGGQRYFTGILRDITARKQTEEALRKAGALQNAIFNSANFSSIATDAKGVIQIFNVGAERMLGFAAADVVDKITPAEISDPQEVIARAQTLSAELKTNIAPGFEALVFKASRGIEDIYELTYIRKDGSRLPAVVSVTALRDDNNSIIGYLLIGTDNTARKLAEAARAQLDSALHIKNIELEAARTVADKANLAKSEFLSSMSHELRSPLNAILGFAQLMESGTPSPTPTQSASIGQILRAGWYLLELINEILDLALIESGKLSISMEPILLSEVLLDCQTMLEPQAQKRGIRMHFPQFDGPCFVEADRTRLKQVLVNLLTNAIKYNRAQGSVEVTFRAVGRERLHINVRDSGEGLSGAKLAQLFQPFNRLGQEDNVEEGTGIGLVVSKRLVELMGGTIGAHSTLGVGSSFWFELNLATPHELLLDPQVPPEQHMARAIGGPAMRTLLYVEDNQTNMELVAQLVARRPDLRLLRAEDGMRGIALARAHLPDLILMDINLPGISGLHALKILREDAATKRIPIMALSANAMPRDIEKGMEAGFFAYLTKPLKIVEFMSALDTGLELAQAASAGENQGQIGL